MVHSCGGCRVRIPLRLASRAPPAALSPLPFSDRFGPYQTPQTRALVSMAIFSTGVWIVGIFFFRQTLKLLLSYHGWMFEAHGHTSRSTKVWAVSGSGGGLQASGLRPEHPLWGPELEGTGRGTGACTWVCPCFESLGAQLLGCWLVCFHSIS